MAFHVGAWHPSIDGACTLSSSIYIHGKSIQPNRACRPLGCLGFGTIRTSRSARSGCGVCSASSNLVLQWTRWCSLVYLLGPRTPVHSLLFQNENPVGPV